MKSTRKNLAAMMETCGVHGIEQVTRRRCKNTGTTVPLLGFGLMRLPQAREDSQDIDYAAAEKMVATAIAHGCNYFDTAYMYHDGKSETFVGDVLSKYPRESYFLASKMPMWCVKNDGRDPKDIFEEQLRKTKAGYFDFYLVHAMNRDILEWVKEAHVYEFLSEMKSEGKIRRLGFSFHDTAEVLQKIVDTYQWDFAQIQLNYYDWEVSDSKGQYEVLEKAGVPTIIMEPVRGGMLAKLSPDASEVFQKAEPGTTNAEWALRYAASLPNVLCVLSGMSSQAQMEENIKTFTGFRPLTRPEQETVNQANEMFRKALAVPCTGCRYCMPCPAGVNIPLIFNFVNHSKIMEDPDFLKYTYKGISKESKASSCVGCGKCASICPQHIQIPVKLKEILKETTELGVE